MLKEIPGQAEKELKDKYFDVFEEDIWKGSRRLSKEELLEVRLSKLESSF